MLKGRAKSQDGNRDSPRNAGYKPLREQGWVWVSMEDRFCFCFLKILIYFCGAPDVRQAFRSFLEVIRVILTEYGPVQSHTDSICSICSMFDAQVASTGTGTHLKRCASKFCVGWWSGDLHNSRMQAIGAKHVPPHGSLVAGTMVLVPGFWFLVFGPWHQRSILSLISLPTGWIAGRSVLSQYRSAINP